MLEISTQLGESVLSQFMEDGVVCPANLQKGLFTTSAVDNIDHNPSATATTSCHGTGISVFQHPVSSTFSDSRTFEFKGQKPKSKAKLPETYTNVKPAFLKSKPNPPILQTPISMSDLDYLVRNLRLEYEWLQFVSLTNEVFDVETVSWSAYHSSTGRGPHVKISISSLTSLLRKKMLSATKLDTDIIAPCTHEEADTRMFLHAKHAAIGGSKSINIVSSDTDVVVIGVAVFDDLNVDHLWMTFGKGKDLRWISIHDIVRSLGPRSKALPFFHAFTGCDTVSAFVGNGKKTAWQAWNVFENATEVFHCLSSPCDNLTQSEIGVFEEFAVIMYDWSSSTNKVNDARLDLVLPVNSVPIMTFLPQELLLLSISNDLSCKQDILGGSRYVSRQLYHHLPGGVGKR